MVKASQSEIFLNGEGDAWFERNQVESIDSIKKWQDNDILLEMINRLPLAKNKQTTILEIGCGQGNRLEYLRSKNDWSVVGLDPSQKAIEALQKKKIEAVIGTAESLPFKDNSFDIIIYGFCLCWVERNALFTLISEANRVTKSEAWIGIYDFWHPNEIANNYHHKEGLKTFKTRPQEMFTWHPYYILTDHRLSNTYHSENIEHPNNWIAATVIRKDMSFCDSILSSQFE